LRPLGSNGSVTPPKELQNVPLRDHLCLLLEIFFLVSQASDVGSIPIARSINPE
jgi:hypothetical protein